jgi:hypothetical protein
VCETSGPARKLYGIADCFAIFAACVKHSSVMARRQSLAALGATALDNEPAAFGAHPLTEPMSFSASAIVGLKSSLHSNPPG